MWARLRRPVRARAWYWALGCCLLCCPESSTILAQLWLSALAHLSLVKGRTWTNRQPQYVGWGGEDRGFSSAFWVAPLALRAGEWSCLALFVHTDLVFRHAFPSSFLFCADGNVHGVPLENTRSALSQVTLVSTMYFKSTWQKKFSFMDTQMLPFMTVEGSTLKVPTMHHTDEVNYGNCPWSRFALKYNMEQFYLFDFHSYCTKRCFWRGLRKSHQTKRPPGWVTELPSYNPRQPWRRSWVQNGFCSIYCPCPVPHRPAPPSTP